MGVGQIISLVVIAVILFENYLLSGRQPFNVATSTTKHEINNDVYVSFRFFNVTNAGSVYENGSKPVLKEIGPYVFKVAREKGNMTTNQKRTAVSYDERRFYHFDAEKSVGSLNDTVMQVDFVAYGIYQAAFDNGVHQFLGRLFSMSKRTMPFKEYRVNAFLFGETDPLLVRISSPRVREPGTVQARMPYWEYSAVFGILIDKKTGQSKNGSLYTSYVVSAGRDATVFEYNNMSRFPNVWPTQGMRLPDGTPFDPNKMFGSIGTSFASPVTKETMLPIFAPDLCMALPFRYKADHVTTLRFALDTVWWREFTATVNRAMCDRDDPVQCSQGGILNATTCSGTAFMMSLPHLLHADPFYQSLVDGLSPNEETHNSYFDVDPHTGQVLKSVKRMQFNVRLSQIPFLGYKRIPNFTMFPIMWVEEEFRAAINEAMVN